MSGIGAKLSRHVLGMKFMRKTKDQCDKSEKASSTPAGASTASSVKSESSNKVKNEPTDLPPSLIVEELWSYNQCERYIFGRQSFGGFNPSVEKNVRKGIWKPFYLDDDENPIDSSDDEGKKKCQSDVDVSDEEMAKTYGSLIGTLAKRFKGNRKGKKNNSKDHFKGKDKKPKWSKKFPENFNDSKNQKNDARRGNYNKRQRESTGSNFEEHGRNRNSQATPSKRHHEEEEDFSVPPQKKTKFLKPSE